MSALAGAAQEGWRQGRGVQTWPARSGLRGGWKGCRRAGPVRLLAAPMGRAPGERSSAGLACAPPPGPAGHCAPVACPRPCRCSAQRFAFKHNLYRLREERDIKPSAFGQMVSATLYERRFGPYFCQPVIGGWAHGRGWRGPGGICPRTVGALVQTVRPQLVCVCVQLAPRAAGDAALALNTSTAPSASRPAA